MQWSVGPRAQPSRAPRVITTLCALPEGLRAHQGFITASHLRDACWIDLLSPTEEEELHAEHLLKLELPNRDELRGLEESSRLHERDGALYLTALGLMLLSALGTYWFFKRRGWL